ncbi:DUF1799 domain-containing protein [Limimaricola variabilis]|uniref:DUF1799 domain-containing protein n=1 Tax=Limimaricola variabilis TaxID=1492771 RepID=UPI002AC9CC3F|nr:DUF1799 domain-containing protein [Limimaricola variabilis]WPY96102.1 DUF1799 domain-containing protein [Limimaricola variabilis]
MRWAGGAWWRGALTDAAPGSDRTADDALSDAARFGIALSAEDLAPAGETGVWPQNAAALTAFLRIATQWRVAATLSAVVRTGLDYAGARAGLDLAGIEMTPALWADVQVIEAGAITAMREVTR